MPFSVRSSASLLAALLSSVPVAGPLSAQETAPAISAALIYQHARFDEGLEPWQILSAELQRRTPSLGALARVTAASRFGDLGQQFELELYPRFGAAGYGYLAGAYSPSGIFPTWRFAGELFRNVGRGFEISGGARYMKFDTVDVRLVTGSVGRYIPHWYLAARPTLVPRGGELLAAGDLLMRRYLDDAGRHVTLRLGAGETPAENFPEADLERQSSLRAGLDGRAAMRGPWELLWSATWERETFPGGRRRSRLQAGLGLEYGF